MEVPRREPDQRAIYDQRNSGLGVHRLELEGYLGVELLLDGGVQRAVISLVEKEVPFERIDIDLANKPDWFRALSPLGKTPVLRVDGRAVFESAVILAIVVLGGMGSIIGVVISSIALVGGIEILRELDFLKQVFGPSFDPSQFRMLIFGIAMVLMMLWKPRGLVSTREPSVFLKERRAISGSLVKEGHG